MKHRISPAPRRNGWPGVLGMLVVLGLLGTGAYRLLLVPPEGAVGVRISEALRMQIASAGYAPPAPAPSPQELGDTWEAVTLPHASAISWELQPATPGSEGPPTRLTWYRLSVPPLPEPTAPFHLFIPNWQFRGTLAIYADGALVYQTHANLAWNSSNQPHFIALPDTTRSTAPRELLFRVQHAATAGEGLSSVWVGTHEALYPRFVRLNLLQTQLGAVSSAAFLATGLFALMVWSRRRSEPIYAYFFLMAAFTFLSSLNSYVGENRLLLNDEWFGWLTTTSTLWILCTFQLFLPQLHGRRHPRTTRTLLILAALLSVATLPPVAALTDPFLVALVDYLFIILLGIGVCLLGLHDSLRAASRDGMLLSGWGVLITLSGAADWAMQSHLIGIENLFLTKHFSAGMVFVLWYIMFQRYVGALRSAQTAGEELAQRLAAREAELADSFARLREVEQRELLGRERQRLMQDMHDGLGSSLRTALWTVEKGQLDESAVADVLKGCIDDLKLAIDSLETAPADLQLLLATWRYRLEPRLENTGIHLRWEVAELPALEWLDPKNALHILRILQEAFANILKHARATEIRVTTSAGDGEVTVVVADDGHGFPAERAHEGGGKGLANQLRRAAAIGAAIAWNSNEHGTCVTLRLPTQRQAGEHNCVSPAGCSRKALPTIAS